MNEEILSYSAGRITIHPDVCNRQPTIQGKRITAHTILEFLSVGDSQEDILRQYPSLESADIQACPRFAAKWNVTSYSERLPKVAKYLIDVNLPYHFSLSESCRIPYSFSRF